VPLLCVIPARLGATRLPNKPLVSLAGEPLIVWVARRVADFGLADEIVVATDARAVADVVAHAGFTATLTASEHQSGTERVAEVIAQEEFKKYDLVLNVQGDEPFLARAAVDGTLARLRAGDPIATAAGPLDAADAADPNRVKVVVSATGHAAYFSRAPIAYDREGVGAVTYRQHVGVYGYTREGLTRWVRLPPVPEEQAERLEQLRPLLHGIPIGVAAFAERPAPGVDTPEDVRRAEAILTHHLKEVIS
jgi:3-deoxy-manno-octulosonate cytidylyltransferase (CMP-KDO synthetase)